MTKPKVFVTRKIAQEALDTIGAIAEVEVWEDELPPPRDMLLKKVPDIDGLLSLLTDKIDATLMDAAPKLKIVSNMAVGYDNIDVSEATNRGIFVGNTPEVLTETTADFTFALLLAAARRVVEADVHTKKGKWKTWGPLVLLGHDIHNATLGIVGFGRIGAAVAKRAIGFNMQVLYYDKVRRPDEERELGLEYVPDLIELLARADFVTLHIALTGETHHLIGAAELAAMKPTAILVNTSRGPVVDQKALYQALRSGRIFAAALDVTEIEPVPPDEPLLTLDNVIITPHIASASVTTRTKMASMAAANLIAGLRGEMPPQCVNPEVASRKG
ncbi:MAG: Glyoxylate/hydroxypyruvate reductase B [Chloroflexi bacterium]|nr:Glyoxylate/hydroxypyruvate reductase B [Chloroflexota bacterium]